MRPLNQILLGLAFAILPAATSMARAEEGPEYNGVFEERNPRTGVFTPLERSTPAARMKIRALGFGGGSSSLEFRGAHSPVRFRASEKLEFVVRVASRDDDPNSTLQFFALTPSANSRLLKLVNVGPLGVAGNRSTTNDYVVPFTATKFGEHFFKIAPTRPLAPGEYTVSAPGTQDGFCFGVDP
jgi:hypothetical protein